MPPCSRLTGTLVTFDRHLNLVLQDVTEYVWFPEPFSRRLHQLFIRGDSVVVVGADTASPESAGTIAARAAEAAKLAGTFAAYARAIAAGGSWAVE